MKFVADEGIDAQIVAHLREKGHQVWYVAEMSPGVPDTEVLDIANRENALLLTFDKDFGDLIFRQRRISEGVILIRLHGYSSMEKSKLVANAIQQYGQYLLRAFTVITAQKVRIRPRYH